MGRVTLLPGLLVLLLLTAVPWTQGQGPDEDESGPLMSFQSFFNITPHMAPMQPLGIRVGESLTDIDLDETLGRHNDLRAGVQPQSSDMEYMSWDTDLAYMAQVWAQGCRFAHGNPPNVSPYTQLGQNIWAYTGSRDIPLSPSRATQDWYDEVHDYDYNSNSCDPGKVCGHYTQVVWATTNKVGCGRVFCPSISYLRNAWFVVCNYAPAGNYQGRHPYNLGNPCTQCASGIGKCYNGLCHQCNTRDRGCECKIECQNCGRLDSARCSCECPDGWWGADCSRPCVNTNRLCGANPGWYDATACAWAPNIPLECPLMCGLCKAGSRSETCDPTSGGGDGGDAVCDIKFTAFVYVGSKLYAFEGKKLWRFRSNGELISDRTGEKARKYFKKMPKSSQGAFMYANGDVGFVKGTKIHRYSGKNPVGGYPKTLSSLGLPKNFKAAFHRSDQGRSGKTYFLKGEQIWRFDESRASLDSGYPKPLGDVFSGIKSNPSGAFINDNGKLHIVYGKKYVTISDDNSVSTSKLISKKYKIPGC